ncbi:MAG: hypothetical protein AB7K36_25640 [Chloroflexota bacterium]
MDSIILAASLISFFVLVGAWIALPASTETSTVVVHGAAARA